MKRGAALGSVLMVISLAMLFSFVLTGSSVFHLRMSWHQSVSEEASNDAEAGLAAAIEYYLQKPSGTQQGANQYSTEGQGPTFQTPPLLLSKLTALHATLTFDPSQNGHGIWACINNLPADSDAETSPQAWPLGQPYPPCFPGPPMVPENGMFLCVNATVLGVTRSAIAIVSMPRFQYALASSGPITSKGGLEVDSMDSSGTMQKKNGNLASNSSDLSWAVQLHSGDLVSGNADAVGRVDHAGATVGGVVDERSAPVPLPSVDLATLDPLPAQTALQMPGATAFTAATFPGASLSGTYYKYQDPSTPTLTLPSLALDQSVLYVNGNLTVNGSLSGTGVVIVTGATTIGGPVNMQSSDQIALVSGGNVTLTGKSGNDVFRGLVFTDGDFQTSHILLEGAFVGNAPNGSNITLDHTVLVQYPKFSSIGLKTSTTAPASTNVPGNAVNPIQLGSTLMNVPWVAYTGPNTPAGSSNPDDYLFGVAGNPGVPPMARGPFLNALAVWLKQTAPQGTTFTQPVGGPNWAQNYMINGGTISVYNAMKFIVPPDASPQAAPNIAPATTTPGPQTITNHKGFYLFDLNQFLTPNQQLQVDYWRVI